MLFVFARREGRSASAAVEALRMEAFAPVGGSRWSLVARPGRVRVVAASEQAFAEGQDLTEFSDPVLGIPVGIEEVAALLAGIGAPVGAATSARPTGEGGAMRLDSGPILWWDRSGGAPQVRRVAASRYRATYPGDWRSGNRQVPRQIELSAGGMEATLRVEELRVNAQLHPEAFELRTPRGFRQVSVRELARSLLEAREQRRNESPP